MKKDRKFFVHHQKGQAVLIVLLSMAVALTVVLSIIASSTSDIKIGTNETQSQRALSAAESGIEQALVTNSGTTGSVNSGASYTASVSNLGQGTTSFAYPSTLLNGESGIFWFVSHKSDGTLGCDASNPCFTGDSFNIYWGVPNNPSSDSPSAPAVEVTVYYLTSPGDYSTTKTFKGVYDPNTTRRSINSYQANYTGIGGCPDTCTFDGKTFAYMINLGATFIGAPLGANLMQFVSVKTLYNTTPQQIGIRTDTALPSQGRGVDSTGSLDQATRKVNVVKGYAGIPSIFDAAIFSPSSLSQ